jgi:hypothetical protein
MTTYTIYLDLQKTTLILRMVATLTNTVPTALMDGSLLRHAILVGLLIYPL